ncbi:MAG: phosphoribosylformimino-5-aminoimidazole carboxamide ribotide isomerase [Oceanospirillaceae bacterium]|jgi:phosphoribosylformimino-5-aminoimidazole carboxamide ribotide isomerase
MTRFRPCIDLHQGKVKQIVGGSLNDQGAQTNFVSEHDASYFAKLYQQHQLTGGHVIALGPNNEDQAKQALASWHKGLQFGGGVNLQNAQQWLDAGASHVIVTSYLFENERFSWNKLEALVDKIGAQSLVLDLSCRKVDNGWQIATNRWQSITQTSIDQKTLQELSKYCAEFLIHSADVEGLQGGIDHELVSVLAEYSQIPVTYAGGARSLEDLEYVQDLSAGKVDLTIGSALDIFGGSGITLEECISWNK